MARCYAESLEKLARRATSIGEHAEAVTWWRKLAAQDPLNARIAVSLMEALVATGDRHAALQHARVYEVLLNQELDVAPDREVLALAERLRRESPPPVESRSAAPPSPPRPAAAPPVEREIVPPPAGEPTPLEALPPPA